ncbi:MAG: M56 family metallopeptidase, partial [Sedimentisphaerales bacterium]|nr:M56 family metallopeptidase [Sedimentisphaerales bacterium]
MNAILEQINSAGLKFVEFALPMFVQSVVLIVILLLADFVLRKKVRAVFRYWIWLLVLVKLILPTSLSSPMSLGYFFGDQFTYVVRNETPSELQAHFAEPESANVPPFIDLTNIEADRFTQTAPPIIQEAKPVVKNPADTPAIPVTSLSWQGAVFLAWLTVVIAMVLLLLQRVIFVRGLVAQAKEASDVMADILESCRSSMSVKRKLGLKISTNAAGPAVCGLFRPVILVPQNLASSLTTDQLRAILLHELAHIKRGDLFVNLVQTLLQIIYFYNPLLWLANCIIRRIREQAVDEMVLVAMGEKAPQYPQTLVSVAKLAFKRPVLSLRLIGVVESKSALSVRIKHILNRPMPKKAKLGIIGLAVVIITGAILLPMASSMPGPPGLVIKGVVKDAQTGEPIAGARVFDDGYGPEPDWEQIRPDERYRWGAITNEAGQYSFLTWPEHHTIEVEASGYKAQRRSLYTGHFVFNKKDQEIFNFTLEPEKVSGSSEFKNTLPNGVKVELVGLFGSESKGQLTWWRPDGPAMSMQESKSYEYRISPDGIRNRDDWKFEYGYILKFIPADDLSSMTDVTVGHSMRYKFPREDGLGVVYVESDEYQRKKGLARIGEIRVAAAYGPSRSFTSEHRVGQDTDIFSLDDGSTILLSPTRPDRYEPDRGLMADTTVNAPDVDIKVFYESKDGNIRNA